MSKKKNSNNKKKNSNNKKKNFNDFLNEIQYDEKTKEYIKEMHELEDKNEFRSNIALASIAIPIILVIALSVIQVARVPFRVMASSNKIEQNSKLACSQPPEDTVVTSDMKNFNTKTYSYLNEYTNRTDSLNKAISLNNGSRKGVNAYLISQILRNNGLDISESTSNTQKLMKSLETLGWEKIYDYSKLEEGDICFTTDLKGKSGSPSHSYIFMGWVENDKTDYAFVCDGQVSEYGSTLHKRNIDFVEKSKDKFNFFMRKIDK
ncbi:hypothetical protein OW763_01840 [Clostridium aestuarii]|uniref:Uncharacterized protein n=1 Tax=Clostridium aestuarii TaxID=338193 RepID=A0ABT4CYA8_9CLOT|nr:hypothetical protein [Clostridium aestuarii]MCY6483095.1 hypothetical protein [Clostridium aestuarii]